MIIDPFGLLPQVDLYAFCWREDAQEWLRGHGYNPLDIIDGSDRRTGHYVIDGAIPTCLVWFDIDPSSFGVTEFAGTVSGECVRLVRRAYAPFIGEDTPCDDVFSSLLAAFVTHCIRECVFQLVDALDIHGEVGKVIPRDLTWMIPESRHALQFHEPSNYEVVCLYRDLQMGLCPIELEERYGVHDFIISDRVERVRDVARGLHLKTV